MAFARAPQIATWLLALALGVQAAVVVTDLAGASRVPETLAVTPAGSPGSAPPAHGVDVAAIAGAHLFGSAEAAAAAEPDAANAPQTSMPLVLTGIISADDPRMGLAIIGESAAAARVRAVGDALPGGARLHSVYGDRVLLDRGGRLESLALPRQLLGGAAPPPPPPAATSPVDDATVARMRRLVSQEPQLMAEVMRPQPVFSQGRMLGFRVFPGRNRQAFMRLGLRPGDVVVAINGTPLDDPARGEEIFRTLGSSSEARVTVTRGGRQQELTLNVAQVAAEAEQVFGTDGMPIMDQSAAPVAPEPTPDVSSD